MKKTLLKITQVCYSFVKQIFTIVALKKSFKIYWTSQHVIHMCRDGLLKGFALSLTFTFCYLFSLFQGIEFAEGKWTVLHSEFLWSSKVTALSLVPDIFNLNVLFFFLVGFFFQATSVLGHSVTGEEVTEWTMNN